MTQSNNDAQNPSNEFTGTQSYIATDDLQLAVNAAITLQKPLLDRKSVV